MQVKTLISYVVFTAGILEDLCVVSSGIQIHGPPVCVLWGLNDSEMFGG